MNIDETLKSLNILLSQTDKKKDKKVYNCFIRTLTSLKEKDLTKTQIQLIHEELSLLKLKTETQNKKKFYNQKLTEFKTFLKNEFSFTSEKYYTELWMIYGMMFGTSVGMSIGISINQTIGISIGLSIGTGVGMALGIMYGARKDAEAKKQGRVI